MPQNPLQRKSGQVAIVGAGPGDPGLLTLRGRELLEQADVVLIDALVNPRLRTFAPRAQWIDVGKRGGRASALQGDITTLLIDHARDGKRVVRLKGGDPFVFGRGGEECQALAEAKVLFEVVPGITAAIAAAAYAGIPVTHRDLTSSFTMVTGHAGNKPTSAEIHADEAKSAIDWSAIARLPCVAFYMAVANLGEICARLIDHGMSPDMPAATIERGTTPQQRTIVSTLKDLPADAASAKVQAPSITIVGRVVELRETLRWFDTRPLFGKTILVTRTRQLASELSARLERLGANVIEAPTIEIHPRTDSSEIDKSLSSSINSPDWLIFTSASGVEFTRRRLFDLKLDARAFAGVKIAAVGAATARAVEDLLCCRVDICPEQFVAEALADALRDAGEVRGKRFLLLRADIARPVLVERLRAGAAAEVRDVAIYETRVPQSLPDDAMEALDGATVDWITFTSSSCAKNLATILGPSYRDRLSGIKLASIGPVTTATLNELGLAPTIEARTYDVDGLVEAILESGKR